MRIALLLALVASARLPALGQAAPVCEPSKPGSDALWKIVSECLDAGQPGYCGRCPAPLPGACAGATACGDTTEVWARSGSFVALRDRKMCSAVCRAGFVHGLALPLARVCGAEDARRPDGIWSFAWDSALKKITRPDDILLVVNPLGVRGQNQLHVHIMRFSSGGRSALEALRPVAIKDLDAAWTAAEQHARASRLSGLFGIAAARAAGGAGYLVAAVSGSPERAFGDFDCW